MALGRAAVGRAALGRVGMQTSLVLAGEASWAGAAETGVVLVIDQILMSSGFGSAQGKGSHWHPQLNMWSAREARGRRSTGHSMGEVLTLGSGEDAGVRRVVQHKAQGRWGCSSMGPGAGGRSADRGLGTRLLAPRVAREQRYHQARCYLTLAGRQRVEPAVLRALPLHVEDVARVCAPAVRLRALLFEDSYGIFCGMVLRSGASRQAEQCSVLTTMAGWIWECILLSIVIRASSRLGETYNACASVYWD